MFSDQPIKDISQDQFGRTNFSERIAQVIASRKDKESIVIGVHAPWGEGKTSVLNLIKNDLAKSENIQIIDFNPWRFPDENSLLQNFFKVLAQNIGGSLTSKKEKFKEFAEKYAGVLSPISAFGFNAKDAFEGVAKSIQTPSVEALKSELENILGESSLRTVIFMDDIDRLDKEEIQAVFRLVKLSADFPNTCYVLSFDIERVAEALEDKYGSLEAGKAFLEKIIQISLPLPPATPENLRDLTFGELNKLLEQNKVELSQEQAGNFGYTFSKHFQSKLRSPRLIKKYINILSFAIPALKGEVNIFDLLYIEAIHVFHPDLYELIRKYPKDFLVERSAWDLENENKKKEQFLKDNINAFPAREIDLIRDIITHIFPRTSAIFGNTHYGRDWNTAWNKEKRIASPDYFQRYFNYGVPPKDVSDVDLQNFVEKLGGLTDDNVVDELKNILSNGREDVFVRKLRLLSKDLSEQFAEPLINAIAANGALFPQTNVEGGLFGNEPFSQACMLIRDLLERVTDTQKRERLAVELSKTATPLDFAYEYFRWSKNLKSSEHDEDIAIVSRECEGKIADEIISRILLEVKEKALEERYPLKSSALYWLWQRRDRKSLRSYLKKRFSKKSEDAFAFLYSFREQKWETRGVVRAFAFDFVIDALKSQSNVKARNSGKDENREEFLSEVFKIYNSPKEQE